MFIYHIHKLFNSNFLIKKLRPIFKAYKDLEIVTFPKNYKISEFWPFFNEKLPIKNSKNMLFNKEEEDTILVFFNFSKLLFKGGS
jgi:hypothetical protein